MDWSIALLILVVILALVGALRWDALRTGIQALFQPPQDAPPPVERLDVPRHLHDERAHQQPPHKPEIHRSGRRG